MTLYLPRVWHLRGWDAFQFLDLVFQRLEMLLIGCNYRRERLDPSRVYVEVLLKLCLMLCLGKQLTFGPPALNKVSLLRQRHDLLTHMIMPSRYCCFHCFHSFED